MYYKDRPFDKKFLLFIPIYSALILSHPQEAFLSQFFVLSLFLVKKIKEKLILVFYIFVSLSITSFWWLPFLLNLSRNSLDETLQGRWLLFTAKDELFTYLASFLIPVLILILFYYYYKTKNKSKKELLFFLPILILAVLFMFKVTPFIYGLRNISPDPFIIFFLFFSIYFFLSINIRLFSKKFRFVIFFSMVLLSVANVAISHVHTSYYIGYSDFEEDTLSVFPFIKEKFMFLNMPKSISHPDYYYGYAPIYYNLSSPSGFYDPIASLEYNRLLEKPTFYIKQRDCITFDSYTTLLNTSYFVAYDSICGDLNFCNLTELDKRNRVCLYTK